MPSTDDLRSYLDQARKQGQELANPQAIKAAVEPYVHRAMDYASIAAERAGSMYASVRNDERVGKYVQSAESVAGTVVETVNTRLVQPVLSKAGMSTAEPTRTERGDAGADPATGAGPGTGGAV